MTQNQLVTSKFQTKSLKNFIEYWRYWPNSTKNKENLCRFTIKIRNYYFWLLFVARKNFFWFDKLLAGMVTKVHPSSFLTCFWTKIIFIRRSHEKLRLSEQFVTRVQKHILSASILNWGFLYIILDSGDFFTRVPLRQRHPAPNLKNIYFEQKKRRF